MLRRQSRSSLPHPSQKKHSTESYCNKMLPIRMKNAGSERTIHIECTQTCSRVHIPHLECPVKRDRHDGISCWTDCTSIHFARMPSQRTLVHSCTRIPHLECLV